MSLRTFSIHIVLFCVALSSINASGCTTVLIPNSRERVMGKSFDWHFRHGVSLSNSRNLNKIGLPIHATDRPAQWKSRYGSVTLHQQARELPVSGMNEEGLAIEIMWLDSSSYPVADNRPSLNELQWIQYQLDNYSTVAEVLAHADEVRVSSVYARVHYLACDKTGACATFEYLGGKLVTHSGESLRVPTLTNDTYADSLKHLSDFVGFGGKKPLPLDPADKSSLSRFVRATAAARQYEPSAGSAVGHAFSILSSVGQGDYTAWNVVYEIGSGRIHFRTLESPTIKTVDTKAFDYSCLKSPKLYDMNQAHEGEVTSHFEDYTVAANLSLVKKGLKEYEALLPPGMLEKIAGYPSTFPCNE